MLNKIIIEESYKPNSVFALLRARRQSFIWDKRCRLPQATYPNTQIPRNFQADNLSDTEVPAHSYLVLLHTGFTCPKQLPAPPVSSYLAVSPLPVMYFNFGRFAFCCTFPSVLPALLQELLPSRYEAYRPMEFGLSSGLKPRDCPLSPISVN